jgi:DNA-binding response OmpR family regulator
MHKIIVIEDSSFMRACITNLLKNHGYEDTVDYAAADVIGKKPQQFLTDIDLIVVDIQLPGMSGIELADILKKDPKYADIPIIFVSGHGDPKTISSAIRAGAADYIVKPFDNDVFLAKVRKVFGESDDPLDKYRYDEKKFKSTVSGEYHKATRGKHRLSLMKFKVKLEDLSRCVTMIQQELRRIDIIFVFNNNIITLLPVKSEEGIANFLEEIKQVFAENNAELQANALFSYSGDGKVSSDDFVQAVLQFAK